MNFDLIAAVVCLAFAVYAIFVAEGAVAVAFSASGIAWLNSADISKLKREIDGMEKAMTDHRTMLELERDGWNRRP